MEYDCEWCDFVYMSYRPINGVGRCFSMWGLQFFKDTELNFQHKTPFGKY